MNKFFKLAILALFLCSFSFILNSCAKYKKKTAPKKIEIKKSFYSMGTFWEIKVVSSYKNKLRDLNAVAAAEKRVRQLDGILSNYKPSSNVSLINRYAGIKPVIAAPDTLRLLKLSLKFYKLTYKTFNVTVEPIMKIWGFYSKKYVVPDDKNIRNAVLLDNPKFIKIKGNKVFLEKKNMGIDFGGDGEGYGIDGALFVLKRYGVKNALINGGGQITAIGKNLKGKYWRVGLLNPLDKNKIVKIIRLKNASLNTSANYENHFLYKGKYYGHIMNPKTGTPINSEFLSDTVIVKNKYFKLPSTVSDALSCAFFILNRKQIHRVIKKLNKPIKVVLIKKADNKPGFKIYLLK
ncbi:MAG: FAD:protein FMN transferase [bacterium]|jgi:thiamine biosynthesis lipoprotein